MDPPSHSNGESAPGVELPSGARDGSFEAASFGSAQLEPHWRRSLGGKQWSFHQTSAASACRSAGFSSGFLVVFQEVLHPSPEDPVVYYGRDPTF